MTAVSYSPESLKSLFGEMSRTYGKVNLITSFGFSARWRRQCVELADVQPGDTVYDLMTGMGECFNHISRHGKQECSITGIDFCDEMISRASEVASRYHGATTLQEDVLELSLPPSSADRIICSFGLKTLSEDGMSRLAAVIYRTLKPGGSFSLVEISEPRNILLRATYTPYIRYIIPTLGWLLLGNPDNYRMLGEYTRAFGNCSGAFEAFKKAGLDTEMYTLFYGCATGLRGIRPT